MESTNGTATDLKRTISVVVENKFGVLARIATLFAARGYNIDSLAVGETEIPAVSRMTIVASGSEAVLEQVEKQLNKLIDVIKVQNYEDQPHIERDLALMKVKADKNTRNEIFQIVDIFRARIVDVATDSLIVEITGGEDKIEALETLLKPFGIKEMVRTGIIAMDADPGRRTEKKMAKVYYDKDADFNLLKSKKIAMLGYGSQGHAHALNLRDSGANVIIGTRPGGKTWELAAGHGWSPKPVNEAVIGADWVMMLMPDTAQAQVWHDHVASHIKPGAVLGFSHGFNIHFKTIVPQANIDVVMIAPKGPGHLVRRTFEEGGGTPALIAVAQNASGKAKDLALAYAKGIGATRAGVLETTFKEETETDLFGEQAVLCGGLVELIKNGYETLTEAGYQPEVAYFECLHEVKLIVDLIYEGGIDWMNHSVSDTAKWGEFVTGPRIITPKTKEEMKKVLGEIQSGKFAKEWIAEDKAGRPNFKRMKDAYANHPIEKVGAVLRGMMPWLKEKGHGPKRANGVAPAIRKPGPSGVNATGSPLTPAGMTI